MSRAKVGAVWQKMKDGNIGIEQKSKKQSLVVMPWYQTFKPYHQERANFSAKALLSLWSFGVASLGLQCNDHACQCQTGFSQRLQFSFPVKEDGSLPRLTWVFVNLLPTIVQKHQGLLLQNGTVSLQRSLGHSRLCGPSTPCVFSLHRKRSLICIQIQCQTTYKRMSEQNK